MWADLFWAPVDGEPYPFDKVVFLASGENYPDALSAGALAAAYAGPVLLTKKDGMPAVTRSALTALAPDHIIVIGGEEAVADDVIWEAAEYVSSLDHVVRRGGKNRWEVSAGLARDTLGAGASTAYVALGTNWPDGLAGGATAGTEMAPLLLTKTDYVPSVVLSALRSGSLDRIVVLGGSQVISQNVLDQLGAIAPVTRVEGGNRYEVAANAADLHGTAYSATAASGQNWPDALAGSAYAGLVGDKMLLLKQEGVPTVTRQAVREHGLAWIEVLGGPVPLPDAVLDSLRAMTVEIPD